MQSNEELGVARHTKKIIKYVSITQYNISDLVNGRIPAAFLRGETLSIVDDAEFNYKSLEVSEDA